MPDLQPFLESIPEWAKSEWTFRIIKVLLTLLIGLPLIGAATRLARKATRKRFHVNASLLITKAVKYTLNGLLILTVLSQLNVKVAAILGAAGVLGVAIGFASQTSLSNVISGLFLIGERPFQIGDLIEINGTTGTIDAINLLSCTLRTPDNKMVRIPNENLIKNQVTNITRHPIRRVDLEIGVSYSEDLDHVLRVLNEIAEAHPLALLEPAPLVIFKGFGQSSQDFLFGVWAEKSDWLKVKNGLLMDIKKRFDAEGIEIPFPHLTLAPGKASATNPEA